MGSAALWRACFARAAPHSASLSLLLFLNVSNVRVHLSEVPLFERRQANTIYGKMMMIDGFYFVRPSLNQ